MKIKSIYINAFGQLKDFSLDFSDGFQVIYGKNEAGKTTVAEFIKSMFYGTGRRAAGQIISVRDKYTPFDGTPAGGRIYFEHSGREFCLERQFRKSDTTDKLLLTDILSGKSEPCASDIGKTLFGITMAAFERSVFIGNTPDFSRDEAAFGEINQKLSSAALDGEQGVSHSKVLNRLDDARLALISKSGKTGSLPADIREHNQLTEALGESDAAARKKQELNEQIAAADERLGEINSEYDRVQKLLENAKDIENTAKLKEYLELKDRLDGITEKLTLSDGTVADEMFLKKFEFGFSKLDNMKERLSALKSELAVLKDAALSREGNSTEQIREKIAAARESFLKAEERRQACENEVLSLEKESGELKEQKETLKDKKKPVNALLLISGALLIAGGAGLYFAAESIPLMITLCAAGLILFVLGFVFRPVDKAPAERIEEQIFANQSKLSAKQNELIMLTGEKNNIEAKIENLNISLNFGVNEEQKIKDGEQRIKEGEEALLAEQEKVRRFFGLSQDSDLEQIKSRAESLYSVADEQKQIKLRLSYLSRDLGGISYEEARERLSAANKDTAELDIEAVKEDFKRLSLERSEAENLKTRLETELKTGFRGLRDPEDLRRQISALKEKIASKQAFYNAVSTAYDVLSDSVLTARKSFGSALEKNTLENLRAITDGVYGAVGISSDFDVSAEKNGVFGMHGAEYLSRGTKDQIYLSLRLAVAKLITEKEPLPIILDDSLSQYDDTRFLSALKFLKEYSKDTEVCLFTCHKHVKQEAEKLNIKTVEI